MAQPGVAEARVPCPLCGGLIHPVAGRCKHCKQDLTALRSGRPSAAAPLPALQQAAPVATLVANESSQPILPPRPTGRLATMQPGPRAAWASWPVIVIIIAVIAILVAVVVRAWPAHDSGPEHTLQPPPAPERMNTDPLLLQGADPWGNNAPHSNVVPRPTPDPATPLPPQDTDDSLPPWHPPTER